MRYLDIGCQNYRLKGFETLDINPLRGIDYVLDASEPLPFEDNTFDLIHASHIIEHIGWEKTETTFREWVRILKVGGWLEIWVPDSLQICREFIRQEIHYTDKGKDPCYKFSMWVYPRLVHKAAFTERYLMRLFREAGLQQIQRMPNSEARHPKSRTYRWRNLGIKGMK